MSSQDHDPSELVELAPPLRPTPAPSLPELTVPAATSGRTVTPRLRATGPGKLRVGVVSGAAVALAMGAVATSLAVAPTSPGTQSGGMPATVDHVPAALDPALGGGDHGRFGGGIFGEISITAISGSSISLATEDGWTRTIAVTDETELTKGGQEIALSDLAVGDQVRIRQERAVDETWTVTALAVVVPKVSGTIGDLSDTSFTVTTRDGSVWTITTNDATTYRYGAADGTRADLADGDEVLVLGESSGANALTATTVVAVGDRVAGTVTAKTGDSLTLETRDGDTVTVHVSSDTEVHVPGVEDAGLDDVAVDMVVGVSGRERSDGSIDAAAIAAGRFGGRDGKPGPGFHRGGGNDGD